MFPISATLGNKIAKTFLENLGINLKGAIVSFIMDNLC